MATSNASIAAQRKFGNDHRMSQRHYILGTAGHIDHGKTALVKALTGVDTDRLKEEKARGLTIDLGFAHLGDNATIIDVPGHEKFIKNMVAGVATIDLVLFVIAADDGIMPQTREHLDILNLLQVRAGIVVISKKDLVEQDWLALVIEEVRELIRGTRLERAPVVPVSAYTGDGIEALQQQIRATLAALAPRHDRGVFWLPVDRSFVMKGFGTIVTGSVLSGQLRSNEVVDLLPQGKKLRVRGLQKHSQAVELVSTGDRAAVNLQGVSKTEVNRGDVLASPGYFTATQRLHGSLRLLASARPLKANTRVRLHLGTAEVMARATPIGVAQLDPGQQGYVQLRLEQSLAARRLDPFVIRQYSPARTIGGGAVLDANARPYRRKDTGLLPRLRSLEQEDPSELIAGQFLASQGILSIDDLVAKTGMAAETVKSELATMVDAGVIVALSKKSFVHQLTLARLQQRVLDFLDAYHQQFPARPGFRKAELAQKLSGQVPPLLLQFALEQLKREDNVSEAEDYIALATHEIQLSDELAVAKQRLIERLHREGFAPPSPGELAREFGLTTDALETVLGVLIVERQLVRLEDGIFLHAGRVAEARDKLVAHLRDHGQISVPAFKELIAGASRKFALPLLNYFDATEVTQRDGDLRFPGAAIDV